MSEEARILRREKRAVRIDTVEGAVEGRLRISPSLRTLDDLNLTARRFVTLYDPQSLTPTWEIGAGPLAINRDAIALVRELSPPDSTKRAHFGTFERSPVRLRVREFEIEGFVHLPKGGDPIQRIEHDPHVFVSLTSVLVARGEEQATAPFVAVNRDYITAVEFALPSSGIETEAGAARDEPAR